MKPRHVAVFSGLFAGMMLLSASTVYQYMTGRQLFSVFASFASHQAPVVITTERCSAQKPLNLTGVTTPELKKLSTYQDACHSFVTGTMMTFVGFPVSQASASQQAAVVVSTLQDFRKHGVRPLVIAEPTDYDTGNNVDFGVFSQGAYNTYLDEYFSAIKATGITDEQMGIWTPFPEANLPYWNNNQASYFAPDVNLYIGHLRKYFPHVATSIMLNSATYNITDFNWQNGEYDSWLPYIKGITPESITYVGIEGFPWVPPAGGAGPILNAAEFLNPDIISEAADYLKVKQIWFNTGTFSAKYTLNSTQTNGLSPEQRKAVLGTINQQALILQRQGYSVAVNMFAEDKSKSAEATDWSYWSGSNPFHSESTPVLTQFISELNQENVAFWLFDE